MKPAVAYNTSCRPSPPRAETLALALALLGAGTLPACADPASDFVFLVRADGQLISGNNTAPPRASGSLFLFEQNDRPADKADTAPADPHHAPKPSADILKEIETTALRYAGHGALKAAGLTLTEWMLFYRANIEVESRYQLQALSPAGAIGPGQLMPATAADLGVDPHDWRQNLDGSARYLLQMLALFGTTELALAGYNAGPEAVRRHGGIPPFPETRSHLARVAQVVARLKGEV